MHRTTILLLSGFALLVAAALWRQTSAEATIAPRPLQLSAPKAPLPAAAGASVGTPAPASARAAKAARGQSPDDDQPVPPRRAAAAKPTAAAASARGAAVVEPIAPAPEAAPGSDLPADACAEPAGAEDLDRAARRLDRIPAAAPSRPEAYEALAAIRLQQRDYYQAAEMFASALRFGGRAAFAVMHDHTRGNFDAGPRDTCAGELTILPAGVRFEGAAGHRFEAGWNELLEAGANRFFGSGIGGFHVKIATARGRSRNFNLAPRSRDKREAGLLLDLLIEHAQRTDGRK
jgi:hypothetical protein